MNNTNDDKSSPQKATQAVAADTSSVVNSSSNNNGQRKNRFFYINIGYFINHLRALSDGKVKLFAVIDHEGKFSLRDEDRIYVKIAAVRIVDLPKSAEKDVEDPEAGKRGITSTIVDKTVPVVDSSIPLELIKIPGKESKGLDTFINENLADLHKYTSEKKENIDVNRSLVSEMLRMQLLEECKEFPKDGTEKKSEEVHIVYQKEAVLENSSIFTYEVRGGYSSRNGNPPASNYKTDLTVIVTLMVLTASAFLAYNYKLLRKSIVGIFRRSARDRNTSQSN